MIEPVQACPPSAGYRFRKFARRNKGLLAVVAGAALVLVLLAAGFVVHHVAITRERDDKQSALDVADAQRQRARQISSIVWTQLRECSISPKGT